MNSRVVESLVFKDFVGREFRGRKRLFRRLMKSFRERRIVIERWSGYRGDRFFWGRMEFLWG